MNGMNRPITVWLLATLALAVPALAHERGDGPAKVAGDEAAGTADATRVLMPSHPATPATPSGGTLNHPTTTSLTFQVGPVPPPTGAATGPGDCLVANCSDYDLLVSSAGGMNVKVRLDWTLVTNDYDLYVFQQPGDTQVISSGNGATTFEEAIFTPQAGVTYQILIVHFAATADQINGVISLVPAPVVTQPMRTGPTGTGIVFSPNGNIQTTAGEAPTGRGTPFSKETIRDGEPSIRSDLRGNVYPAGIRGVPAGVDVWRFGPNAKCPRFEFYDDSQFPNPGTDPPASGAGAGYVWLGQPDGIFVTDGEGSPDLGGGDIELAVSFPALASVTPTLSMVSLTLVNITSAKSLDRGNNWSPANPVAATVPLDDRQWIDSYGDNTVYLYYRTLATLTGLVLNKSIDGGQTFATATNIVNPLGFTPGWIAVDKSANPDGSVDIYLSGQNSTELVVFHCVDPTPAGVSLITCTQHSVDKTMSHGHIFDPVAVGTNGDVYASWSNNVDAFYAWSDDKAATWHLVQVTSAGAGGMPSFNFFPWITAGSNGRIGIVWFGATNGVTTSADNNAEWKAFYAYTANAKAVTPNLLWLPASDHVIHKHNLSQGGLSLTDDTQNRNLIDFFEVAYDPRDGGAVIAYGDDHNDFDGATYYTRQIGGLGLLAGKNVFTPNCPALQPFKNPEVRDFLGDPTVSADITFPVPDLDIVNMGYGSKIENNNLFLQAEIIVGLLPPLGQRSYRAYFSVNTARGLLDVGNEYFIEMVTDVSGLPSQFWLGVTDRNPNGTTAEMRVEDIAADQIATPIRPGTPGNVLLRVNVSRLDWSFVADSDPNTDGYQPLATDGGSTVPVGLVIGLRGRTRLVTPVATSLADETRGGSFIILKTIGGGASASAVESNNPAISSFGGWHIAVSPANDAYSRHVSSGSGGQRPFMEFQFKGRSTSVRYDYFTSGRGSVVEVFIDGQSKGTIDQFRASPDPSGTVDLVKASRSYTVAARPGNHTFRVEVRTDLATASRNIAYVRGFSVAGGAHGTPATVDRPIQFTHVLGSGQSIDHVLVADPMSLKLTAVIEPTDTAAFGNSPLTAQLFDAVGALVGSVSQVAPGTLSVSAPGPGNYVLRVTNTGNKGVGYNAALVESERTF
jgi:hypothetical protein